MKAVSNAIPSERSSIYDVARLARVSPATVSRFTRDASAVAPATRLRLAAAVTKLQFRPSALARAVAARGRQSVGLILTSTSRPHAGFVLAELLSGISAAAANAGWSIHLTQVTSPTSSPARGPAVTDPSPRATGDGAAGTCAASCPDTTALLARHADLVAGSLILDSALDNAAVMKLARSGKAVVVNRPVRGVPWVGMDNHLGGRIAAAHLVLLGHRRIAILAGDGASGLARLEGSRDELRAAGLRPTGIVGCRYSQDEAYVAARRLLERNARPSAILCGSDWMAAGVLRAARDLAIAVPTELSIVGFDDAILASVTSPDLTTVRQPLAQIGLAAFQMLHLLLEDAGPRARSAATRASSGNRRARLAAGGADTIAPLLVPPSLVVRGSTAPPPASSSRASRATAAGRLTNSQRTASRGRREIHSS